MSPAEFLILVWTAICLVYITKAVFSTKPGSFLDSISGIGWPLLALTFIAMLLVSFDKPNFFLWDLSRPTTAVVDTTSVNGIP